MPGRAAGPQVVVDPGGIVVRSFVPADQEAARQLILAGLQEHFGELDARLNDDLADIDASYTAQGHAFLVAQAARDLVGTGALIVGETEGQIVRVSVASAHRRKGIARALVAALLTEARTLGLGSVWMETNDDWQDALAFYRAAGFAPFDRREGCIFMRFELARNHGKLRA